MTVGERNRDWITGVRGFLALGLAIFAIVAVWSLLSVLRLGQNRPPGERTADSDHAAESDRAELYRGVVEEQRKLLEEETRALREERRRLHDERIAARRDRIALLAERYEDGETRRYDKIELHNACKFKIAVAVHYRDLDDEWITRGWWNVEPGETTTTDAMTRNAYVYFFAENQSEGRSWNGDGDEHALELKTVDNRFDHLRDDPWVYDQPRTVSFFRRHTGEEWTDHVETFECLLEAR